MTHGDTMIFELTKEQYDKYLEWKDHCDTDGGAIGGRHAFKFIPTSLGVCAVVECLCGEKINLTDFEEW